MTKRKSPAKAPAPEVDANNDGHDDRTGQFVEGNQEAADAAPLAPEASPASSVPEADMAAPAASPEPAAANEASASEVAAEPAEVTELVDVEANLIAATEAFLAAAVAFAEVPETPVFYKGEGYRLQFAGHQLYSLLTA